MTNPVPATPTIPVPTGKRACVIGAGFGGLALAIRLQSAGIETVVVEARDKPGGRGYHWQQEGFTFDAGPTVITDPACLTELWGLTGHDMAEDVTLKINRLRTASRIAEIVARRRHTIREG